MAETERLNRLCNTIRLHRIDGERLPGLYRAIMTAPRTDIAEDQECRGAGVPAFPPVWTTGLFTNRVKVEPLHHMFNIEIIRAGSGLNFKPGGKTRSALRQGLASQSWRRRLMIVGGERPQMAHRNKA